MDEMEGERRPKRNCAGRKSAAAPSAVHYVGYVEDNETPEMIMKKFEELEKVANCLRASLISHFAWFWNYIAAQHHLTLHHTGFHFWPLAPKADKLLALSPTGTVPYEIII